MINIIRKEPVIKKSIFIMMMSIIVIFSIFTVFQYNNLKNIYLEQENINKRVVGILVNKYPQQEVDIVKSIYKQDNRYLDLGAKTLDKYGYDNNYNMYDYYYTELNTYDRYLRRSKIFNKYRKVLIKFYNFIFGITFNN